MKCFELHLQLLSRQMLIMVAFVCAVQFLFTPIIPLTVGHHVWMSCAWPGQTLHCATCSGLLLLCKCFSTWKRSAELQSTRSITPRTWVVSPIMFFIFKDLDVFYRQIYSSISIFFFCEKWSYEHWQRGSKFEGGSISKRPSADWSQNHRMV